jgi:hypothetical protein
MKLKLTKCAPISGLPEIGFFMPAQAGQDRRAPRESAPGLIVVMGRAACILSCN